MMETADDASGLLPQPARRSLSPAWQSFLLMWFCQVVLLFASTGSRLWIAAFIIAAGAWTVTHVEASVEVVRRNAILFLIPLFYLFSSTWSLYPVKTLYSDAELVGTFILTLAIVAAPDRRAALTGQSLAYATFTIISLIFGKRVFWEAEGLTAFAGLGGGKNFFGHTSALTAIVSLSLLMWVWDAKQSPAVRLLSLAAFGVIYLLSAYAVVIARASGSIIAMGVATFVFVATLIAGRSRGSFRFLILFAAASMLLLFALFGDAIKESVTGLILSTFHKTPALSGRMYFWATADKIIADHPMLGIGYDAFWTHGNPTAEGLWSLYKIGGRSGITFHNTPREIRVEGGLVGMCVLSSTIGYLLIRQALRALMAGDAIEALGVGIVSYFLSRIFTENVALSLWSSDTVTILFFIAVPIGAFRRTAPPPLREQLDLTDRSEVRAEAF